MIASCLTKELSCVRALGVVIVNGYLCRDNTHSEHRTQIIPPHDGTCFVEIVRSFIMKDEWRRIEYVSDAHMRHRDDEGRSLKNHDVLSHEDACSAGESVAVVSAWMRIRRGLLLLVGCGCVMLGMVLVVTVIRPEALSTLGTAELGAIVSLVVLPIVTMLTIRYERSVLSRSMVGGYKESAESVRVSHAAHDRSGKTSRPIPAGLSQTQKPRTPQEARGV